MNRENYIGNRIRELRKSYGLTQEQFAEKVGLDNKYLSKIENGLHLPTYKTLQKISEALNEEFDFLNVYSLNQNIKPNPILIKSMKILNSAHNDKEQKFYYEILKLAQKGLLLR